MSDLISASLVESTEKNNLTKEGKIPRPQISSSELLVKAVAFAANPTDWKHIAYGMGKKGDISGSDVSGVVVEVGKDVSGFAVGDQVSVFLRGGYSPESGAFAEYVRAPPVSTIKYDHLDDTPLSVGVHESGLIKTFEDAASVTLGLVTATLSFAYGLHIKEGNGAILIWSGATATGVLAIQVAKLVYGLKVITTASPKHHSWLKSIGADAVFDYHDDDVVDQIKKYANGSINYALDTVSNQESFQALYDASAGADFVALDNLLGLQGSNITETPGRRVSYGKTMAYLVHGKSMNFGPTEFVCTPELVADFNAAWAKVMKIVPQLHHSKLKVLEPGFGTAAQALELLREDKVSGEKVVWRAA